MFKGIHSDKNTGIQQLEIGAAHGHYLRPFAKILLALAALREKRVEVARTQLTELVAEFPKNSLFASELTKINACLGSSRSESVPLCEPTRNRHEERCIDLFADSPHCGEGLRESALRVVRSVGRHQSAVVNKERSYEAVGSLPAGSFRPQFVLATHTKDAKPERVRNCGLQAGRSRSPEEKVWS